jgi:hypothetical protein
VTRTDHVWGLLHGHWILGPEVLEFLEEAGLMADVPVPPGKGFGSMHELTPAGRAAFEAAAKVQKEERKARRKPPEVSP